MGTLICDFLTAQLKTKSNALVSLIIRYCEKILYVLLSLINLFTYINVAGQWPWCMHG